MSSPSGQLPCVATTVDMASHDGQKVEATGIYWAIPAPRKGPAVAGERKTHAVLELDDGKRVYLEAFGVEQAIRSEDELRRFDGHRVTIVGVAHMIMPSPREGLVAPCLSEVESIVEADLRGSETPKQV
ncbi:hypothetical protein [Dyella tabacisoli]|uniref:Uncharacterized protein n=1 Tax=Dyella tabacisoli TaxID=2282381 RepID=A0A369UKX3_9GAMM|nr:hypothetical protein [Dyella tabacisoli]RDD81216.1 hypothetical protein DVJ77_12905 [Dyella tabacisoli]